MAHYAENNYPRPRGRCVLNACFCYVRCPHAPVFFFRGFFFTSHLYIVTRTTEISLTVLRDVVYLFSVYREKHLLKGKTTKR